MSLKLPHLLPYLLEGQEGGMLVDIGVGASFVIVISAMLTVVLLR